MTASGAGIYGNFGQSNYSAGMYLSNCHFNNLLKQLAVSHAYFIFGDYCIL